jgi:two-component system NarL family sensor kinase
VNGRLRRALPWIAVAVATLLALATVVLALVGRGRNAPPDGAFDWTMALLVPAYLPVVFAGALLYGRRRQALPAVLLLIAGVALPLAVAANQYAVLGLYAEPGSVPGPRYVAWLGGFWFLGPPLLAGPLLLLLPDGRPQSRRWGIVAAACGAGVVCSTIGSLLGPLEDFPGVSNPFDAGVVAIVLQGAFISLPLGAILGMVGLWRRARRGPPEERRALRPLVATSVPIMIAYVLCIPAGGTGALLVVQLLASSALALACLAAAGRGVWVVAPLLRRKVLRVLLGGVAVGLAAALVLTGLQIFGASIDRPLVLIVAAAAAFPLRFLLERGVDRLLHGDRDEPVRALRTLAEHLAAAPQADEAAGVLAAAAADALAVPYVEVVLFTGESGAVVAHGVRPDHDERETMDLRHRGRTVGQLKAASAHPDDRLEGRSLRLFADLARQAGPAMAAAGLVIELERSRNEIVRAREEERRRLRDDLHDGLGPALAALGMQADMARDEVGPGANGLDRRLLELREGLDVALADVRRLVYGLRPPALDELGLVGALREHASRLEHRGGLEIAIEAPATMPALPAAVEVAAYRIAQEALTNVARHAGACQCDVRIDVNGTLALEVADNGCGLKPGAPAGVGLASMRRRAAELGGELELVARESSGGLTVRARLPLDAQS